jgi:hypothetical protein
MTDLGFKRASHTKYMDATRLVPGRLVLAPGISSASSQVETTSLDWQRWSEQQPWFHTMRSIPD